MSQYDDYDDPDFLQILQTMELPEANDGPQDRTILPPQTAQTTNILASLPANTQNAEKESEAYAASDYGGIGDYLRRKRLKLKHQEMELAERANATPSSEQTNSPSSSRIFAGLHIYITGHVVPSFQVLRRLITQHGGTFETYLDRKSLVTHIIASNLTPAKRLEFANLKVCTP